MNIVRLGEGVVFEAKMLRFSLQQDHKTFGSVCYYNLY
jgi:hypothetical protein